jgi:hypothetical protein
MFGASLRFTPLPGDGQAEHRAAGRQNLPAILNHPAVEVTLGACALAYFARRPELHLASDRRMVFLKEE